MNKLLLPLISLFFSFSIFSQEMTVVKLDFILNKVSPTIQKNNSRWSFQINDVNFIVVADTTYNRMRIISPIVETSQLSEELKTASLIANFHTALDIKYAISGNILWAAFIHPLKELSEEQVKDAITQVYYGNVNFGTTFSSTPLVFPSNKKQQKAQHNNQYLNEKI